MFYRNTTHQRLPFTHMPQNETRRSFLAKGGAATGSIAMTSLAGCSMLGGDGGTVKISSKRFTEQKILGYMAYHALKENTDLNVVDETGLGGSTQNFQAVKNGEVDMYWEYTGTAWYTVPPQHDKPVGNPEELYKKVKSEFESEHGLAYLDRAPLNNTFVLMANPDWAKKTGVSTMSQLAAYINDGNTDLDIVLTTEYIDRPDGWQGTAEHYGFADKLSELSDSVRETGIGLSYQIVGKGEADVGLGYNTNPQISKWDLEVLKDDKQFFPIYNPAPLINSKTYENHGDAIAPPLNKIGPKLDTDTMRGLNKAVAIDEKKAENVATNFLSSEGII